MLDLLVRSTEMFTIEMSRYHLLYIVNHPPPHTHTHNKGNNKAECYLLIVKSPDEYFRGGCAILHTFLGV